MKKLTVSILLFISAIVNTVFSFFFLIYTTIERNNLTNIVSYARIINNFLFFGSLFFIFFSFFFKNSMKAIVGISCFLFGALNIFLIISFKDYNYYFLVPLGMYLISGLFVFTYNKPLYK